MTEIYQGSSDKTNYSQANTERADVYHRYPDVSRAYGLRFEPLHAQPVKVEQSVTQIK